MYTPRPIFSSDDSLPTDGDYDLLNGAVLVAVVLLTGVQGTETPRVQFLLLSTMVKGVHQRGDQHTQYAPSKFKWYANRSTLFPKEVMLNRRQFISAAAANSTASLWAQQRNEWGGNVLDIHLHLRPDGE